MTTDFCGRKYFLINKSTEDELHCIRHKTFEGLMDAQQCAEEGYKIILKANGGETFCSDNIFYLHYSYRHTDVGCLWVVNNDKQIVIYEGIRSFRVADKMKYFSTDNPYLFTKDEYESLIELHFKYYGPYFFRQSHTTLGERISKSEVKYCEDIIKKYNEQVLQERRIRQPKFGDTVRGISGILGRFIGKGQILMKNNDNLIRDLIDMEADWGEEMKVTCAYPTDSEMVQYLKESQFL